MSFSYQIHDQYAVYFVTFTVHQWVDVFTRNEYKDILLESLRFCQERKGLEIYAWVIMTNHIHLIISSREGNLSDIIRDFKKYTSNQVIKAIEQNPRESRKKWLLWLLKKDEHNILWQEGYHGEEIRTKAFYETKERYIHLNPVRSGMVYHEDSYIYSSYASHSGLVKGLLKLSDF